MYTYDELKAEWEAHRGKIDEIVESFYDGLIDETEMRHKMVADLHTMMAKVLAE